MARTFTLNALGPVLLTGVVLLCGCASVPPPVPEAILAPREEFAPVSGPVTVDLAVTRALAHDPDLRAAHLRTAAAFWQKVQASLPANPQLGATLDPGEWVARLSVRITDLLDLGGRRRAAVQAGQSREEQAALAVWLRQIDLVQEVRSVFAEAWTREQRVQALQAQVAVLTDLVTIARQQRELGELSALDVLQLDQRLQAARMAVHQEQWQQRQAAARLNRLLGLPLSTVLDLVLPADGSDWFSGQAARLATTPVDTSAADLGRLQRPELALVVARAREQQALLGVARVSWLDGEAGPYLKQGDGPTVAGGHATLTVPIFDRGQARQGAQASLLAALEQEMLAVQADLLLDVQVAWWTLRHHQQRLHADLPAMRGQATAVHALLRQAEALGAVSAVEVQLAHLEVLEADLALLTARQQTLQAVADLAAALGDRGLPDSEVTMAPAQQGRDHDGQD
jgi:outer membrane protein, heavy metal efflux system